MVFVWLIEHRSPCAQSLRIFVHFVGQGRDCTVCLPTGKRDWLLMWFSLFYKLCEVKTKLTIRNMSGYGRKVGCNQFHVDQRHSSTKIENVIAQLKSSPPLQLSNIIDVCVQFYSRREDFHWLMTSIQSFPHRKHCMTWVSYDYNLCIIYGKRHKNIILRLQRKPI